MPRSAKVEFRGEVMSYAQVARIVGVSADTVRRRRQAGEPLDLPVKSSAPFHYRKNPGKHMFAGEQRTYREIAEMTGLPIGTVKSRIHYGRPLGEPLRYQASHIADRRAAIELSAVPFAAFADDDVCRRLVSNNPNGMRLEEIGIALGCTRERVRQIEHKAISKLKRFGVTRRQLESMRDQRDYARDIRDARESGYRRRAS